MSKKIYLKARRSTPRLDRFLVESMGSVSRARIEKLISEGGVHINGRPASRKNQPVAAGDRIEVAVSEPAPAPPRPAGVLQRHFEDEWLLIIEKPAGIAVHPGAGPREETILDIFRCHCPQIDGMSEKERPGLVHRLDKETSGLLLLAKDERTMRLLQDQFRLRSVRKGYLALVNGNPQRRVGRIDLSIGRDPRLRVKFRAFPAAGGDEAGLRTASTEYEVLRHFKHHSLLRVRPLTGRTHQIRVHLAAIGHPVAGDTLYGGRRDRGFPRLALHAHRLEFVHPHTQNVLYATSPLPAELRGFIASLFGK